MKRTMDITPHLSGLVGFLRSLARDQKELAVDMAIAAWPKLSRAAAGELVAGEAELVDLLRAAK